MPFYFPHQLMWADIIVIGAPLWNFGTPSVLKAWIDHIARAGVTFKFTGTGAEGLIKDKTVYIAMASGGIYSDLTVFRVEGSAFPGEAEPALQKGIDSIKL